MTGDWSDTQPKNNTDRTASTIELVNKIEELNKWLDLKSEYIEKLEKENERLKWWLREIVNNHRFTPISTAEKALKEIEELKDDREIRLLRKYRNDFEKKYTYDMAIINKVTEEDYYNAIMKKRAKYLGSSKGKIDSLFEVQDDKN